MSVCVALTESSDTIDPNVLPVLGGDRPLRIGDRLDYYISLENFLDTLEDEQVISREWTTNGPVDVDSYAHIAELAVVYEGVEYRYLQNEKVLLTVPVDAETGPAQVFCKITTDRDRIATFAFVVNVSQWPDLE